MKEYTTNMSDSKPEKVQEPLSAYVSSKPGNAQAVSIPHALMDQLPRQSNDVKMVKNNTLASYKSIRFWNISRSSLWR